MIQGFTSHALVIYPLLMDYRGRGSRYFLHLNAAATNLQKYLRKNNITYDCFITDDAARESTVQPDRWLQTLNAGEVNPCIIWYPPKLKAFRFYHPAYAR